MAKVNYKIYNQICQVNNGTNPIIHHGTLPFFRAEPVYTSLFGGKRIGLFRGEMFLCQFRHHTT